jgi:hypothetical protein
LYFNFLYTGFITYIHLYLRFIPDNKDPGANDLTEHLSATFSLNCETVKQNESIIQSDASIDDFNTIIEGDSMTDQTDQTDIACIDQKDNDGENVYPVKKHVIISAEPLKQEEDLISNELTNKEESVLSDDFDDNLESSGNLDEHDSTGFTSQEVYDIQDDGDVDLSQDEDLIHIGQNMPIHPKPSIGADTSMISIDNKQFEEDWDVSMIENADNGNFFREENTDSLSSKDKADDDVSYLYYNY